MPTLGNALDFAKYEARNIRAHQLGTAPAAPVTGQLYYNTADNTLYWWNGTAWISATGGVPSAHHLTHEPGGSDPMAVDAAVGVGSLRTLGMGAQQALPGNKRLDQITAPLNDLSLNGQRITLLMDPQNPADAATKLYVDNTVQGLSAKGSVWAASTGNVAMTSGGSGYNIDGVTFNNVTSGTRNRVLLKDQTNPVENGIYIVSGTAGGTQTLARATDMDSMTEFPGAYTWVESGTVNAETGWVCTTDPVAGTTIVANAWTQFSGAGQIVSGAGLTKTGNTLDVGAGSGITVAADTVGITPGGVTDAMLATAKSGYYSTATHGAGTTIAITQATHALRASRGLIVQCQVDATGAVVLPDISIAANGDVTITFGVSQTANTIRTTIVG